MASPVATLDDLLSKPRRTRSLDLQVPGPEGEARNLRVVAEALSGDDFDDLVAKYPPTKEQREKGFGWNPDEFLPRLIAATLTEPRLNVEQAKELWSSPNWSVGELSSLVAFCQRVNQESLGVPFTETGSSETPDSP